MTETPAERVACVRAFNRFWTGATGLLDAGLLDTPYSLTEARVLFELAQRDVTEARELREELGLDSGYLSRILGRFREDGLVTTEQAAADARRQVVRLTDKGRAAFAVLDARSAEAAGALLSGLSEREQLCIVGSMSAIRDILASRQAPKECTLRPLRAGDLGWVVERHGELYADEYGWDDTFEALVARILADYVEQRDASRENGWLAELDGERAGCVFCTRRDETVAQLRLLLVEPHARGAGVGTRLVDECIRFARDAGYERITLWTNSVLHAARRIYERAGFELVEEERHRSFGHELVGQHWWLTLPARSDP